MISGIPHGSPHIHVLFEPDPLKFLSRDSEIPNMLFNIVKSRLWNIDNVKICDFSLGKNHLIAMDTKGHVYVYGNGLENRGNDNGLIKSKELDMLKDKSIFAGENGVVIIGTNEINIDNHPKMI